MDELQAELDKRIGELDNSSALIMLATIEAYLRIDYIQRCEKKDKDPLSRKFRKLHKIRGNNANLSDDILEVWKDYVGQKSVISDLRSAFNFRHWLAHGRYWKPKLGRRFDFNSILNLAISSQSIFRIDMGA